MNANANANAAQKYFYAFTMDTFALIAFGVDFNSLETEHEFAVAFDGLQAARPSFMHAPRTRRAHRQLARGTCMIRADCQRLCTNRFQNPIWKLVRLLKLTAEERRISVAYGRSPLVFPPYYARSFVRWYAWWRAVFRWTVVLVCSARTIKRFAKGIIASKRRELAGGSPLGTDAEAAASM